VSSSHPELEQLIVKPRCAIVVTGVVGSEGAIRPNTAVLAEQPLRFEALQRPSFFSLS
jgi:hypothetical protein